MSGGIFLIQEDGKLVEMNEQAYDSEELLQRLLAQYPSLLAGSQIDSETPRRWLLICREAALTSEEGGADRWSVDHLFLDQDGIPTLVEVKRSSDTRIRREVVGQMLDYAANAVLYWPVEEVRAKFGARCTAEGQDAEQELNDFLSGELESEDFWALVKSNFQTGKIRMLFVADEIPNELRRIVEFLNQQMEFAEVLAVEIKQFAGQGLQTLVPRVMGQSAEAERAKSAGGQRRFREWDETSFFEELQKNVNENLVRIARKLSAWGKAKASGVRFGSGTRIGTLIPFLEHKESNCQCFSISTNGEVGLAFGFFGSKLKPFDQLSMREELRNRLNQIPGISIPAKSTEGGGFIGGFFFNSTVFLNQDSLDQFLATFDWFVEQARAV